MTNNSASLFTKNEGTSTDTGYSIHGGGNKSEDPLGTNNENNTWNYSSIVYQLKSEVNSIPCEALDSIIDINVDVPGFWDS